MGNPMPKLEWKNRSREEMNVQYGLRDVNYVDSMEFQTEIEQSYPETKIEKDERVASCQDYMTEGLKTQGSETLHAHIVVSHMWFHETFCDKKGGYCSITGVK